jgi:hypothetical protein
MSNVILVVTKPDNTRIAMAVKEEGALEVGKHLVFTTNAYTSARIESITGKPMYVIDKDIPDWSNCQPTN